MWLRIFFFSWVILVFNGIVLEGRLIFSLRVWFEWKGYVIWNIKGCFKCWIKYC